jgi:AsmA-like protein
VVDGTDGDTYLNDVSATLLETSLSAKGAITGTKGVKGRTVKLDVHITEGRIEHLLKLSVKAEKPVMVGDVGLHTDFLLPPGEGDVIERLNLAGKFDLESARFTDRGVQTKITGMSQRARGTPDGPRGENVVSDLRGRFRLQDGVLSFSDLTFVIPGATVNLQGTYGLRSEAIAFDGTLRMEATISEAAGGGMKSVFLKLVDPLFRKRNAGAVVPIKVTGTRKDPKIGLDVGKVFKRSP